MNTRMEKVAEDIALTALRKVGSAAQPPLQPEKLKDAFQAGWPVPDSRRPMNDAMTAAAHAASNCAGQDADNWKITVSQAWRPAVEEVVEEYFKAARNSFEKGEPLEGVETLTDAVRATLGHIAAVRNWSHSTHENLYSIAAALGSGRPWPDSMEEFDEALMNRSEEGKNLGAALVLQRQFKAGWPGMHGEWRDVWRETGWPDGCATAPPVAVATNPPARTTHGAASHAPPGTPADG